MNSNLTPRDLDSDSSIPAAFQRIAAKLPDKEVYFYPNKSDQSSLWQPVRYPEIRARINRLSRFFIGISGFRKGSKVAIISGTRPEWCEVDLAILAAGGVTVSVYPSLPSAEVGFILHDSGAEILIVENQEQFAKVTELQNAGTDIPAVEDREGQKASFNFKVVIGIEQISNTPGPIQALQLSEIFSNEQIPATPLEIIKDLTRNDVSSIVYTSGTSGAPKGVVQTHGNHLANVRQAWESGVFGDGGVIFLYLPLAHSFARLIYYIGFLSTASIRFSGVADTRTSKVDLPGVARDMRESGATVFPSVPRLFEKAMEGLVKAANQGGMSGYLVKLTLHHAAQMFEARRSKRQPGLWNSIIYQATDVIRRKIKAQIFGSNFSHAVSGGAKLPVNVNEFFESIGLDIYEGYGLTETCVATNVNPVGKKKIGSVGPCFKDIEIRIDPEDGEILFRGPNITSGYFNRPQATAAAWNNEGWFRTGDVGRLDEEGYLYITDRKKDLIVTSGGKKIPPQHLEGHFKSSKYISEVVVFGDEKPYCVALIALDMAAVKRWAQLENIDLAISAPHQNPKVNQLIESEIARLNSSLASYETIKRFRILDHEFTIDNGFLTPTLKVKRKAVIQSYRDLIEEIYLTQ